MDLAFVKSKTHRTLLKEILDQADRDSEIIGVMLSGSVARGDAYPGSDLDVHILLNNGCRRAFQSEIRQGILVECHYDDFELANSKLEKNPMKVYAYLDGRILYDPEGRLRQLVHLAGTRLEAYRISANESNAISYWLESARGKILAAKEAGDELKAAYITSVTSWKILEGIWAANEKPMPPGGAVWAHIKDLSRGPPHVEAQLRRLFEGDTLDRIGAAVEIIEWILPILRGPEDGAL